MLSSSRAMRLQCGFTFLLLGLVACGQSREAVDLALYRGRNALAMARYDWARIYFATDVAENPERVESWRGLGLGWVSGYQGSLSHAIKAFERYLQLVPQDKELSLQLARSRLQVGDAEGARRALEALESSLERELLIARIDLAENPAAARDRLLLAIDKAPESFEARHLAAQAFARLGADAEAMAEAAHALRINPLSSELSYLMARVLRRQGKGDEAAEALATYGLLSRFPGPGDSPDPRHELALLRQLEASLAPTSATFKKRLARALLETGRIAEARPLLDAILATRDPDLESLLFLAQVAHTQGETSIARDYYRYVLEHAPEHRKALAQNALLAYETHDYQSARQFLGRGLQVAPEYAPLHFTTGLVALAEGDEALAAQSLARSVDLVPWLSRYRLTLADVLLTGGDRAAVEGLLAAVPAPDPAIDAYRKKHSL